MVMSPHDPTPFQKLVRGRRSIRRFLETPVEREKVLACLEAARLAPSASNVQPWTFIVVDEPGLREAVARATFGKLLSFNRFTLQAPVLVAVVTETSVRTSVGGLVRGRPYGLIDIGIAAQHFCLRAEELGLGTCMLGWFDEKSVKRLLGVPRQKHLDMIITLGYPAENSHRPKKRKSLEEILCFNRYGGRLQEEEKVS
jgi:nitroreductase